MRLRYTPGPWHYIGSTMVEANRKFASRFEFLLSVKGAGAPPQEWEANARLIAAAPDLYRALRDLVAMQDGEDFSARECYREARLAIAKAEGMMAGVAQREE